MVCVDTKYCTTVGDGERNLGGCLRPAHGSHENSRDPDCEDQDGSSHWLLLCGVFPSLQTVSFPVNLIENVP